MALRPDSPQTPADKLTERRVAEQDVLMREVDEAVRQDEIGTMAKRYGWPIGIALALGLAGFGGWLLWQDHSESRLEEQSERLVTTLDELEAGNMENAGTALAELSDGSSATAVSARLARAGLALRDNRRDEAIQLYEGVAADGDAPQPYRDLALVRSVAANFDRMEPQQVVDRLKPLAVPGNPWFGSAGELVAMAYLEQDREDLAGPLFAKIAMDEDVPQTLRSRARQMAGLLGQDAIEDVDQALTDMREESAAVAQQ